MTTGDVYNTAKTVFTLFDAYVNTVVQEIGEEKAEELMIKTCEFAGMMQGLMMKEQSDIKVFDAQAAWSLVRVFKDNLGATYEVLEESPQRILIKNKLCPMYEAAHTIGTDVKTIEKGCLAGPMTFMGTAIKQLNPNLNLVVRKFRKGLDDFCEEEISLR